MGLGEAAYARADAAVSAVESEKYMMTGTMMLKLEWELHQDPGYRVLLYSPEAVHSTLHRQIRRRRSVSEEEGLGDNLLTTFPRG